MLSSGVKKTAQDNVVQWEQIVTPYCFPTHLWFWMFKMWSQLILLCWQQHNKTGSTIWPSWPCLNALSCHHLIGWFSSWTGGSNRVASEIFKPPFCFTSHLICKTAYLTSPKVFGAIILSLKWLPDISKNDKITESSFLKTTFIISTSGHLQAADVVLYARLAKA